MHPRRQETGIIASSCCRFDVGSIICGLGRFGGGTVLARGPFWRGDRLARGPFWRGDRLARGPFCEGTVLRGDRFARGAACSESVSLKLRRMNMVDDKLGSRSWRSDGLKGSLKSYQKAVGDLLKGKSNFP